MHSAGEYICDIEGQLNILRKLIEGKTYVTKQDLLELQIRFENPEDFHDWFDKVNGKDKNAPPDCIDVKSVESILQSPRKLSGIIHAFQVGQFLYSLEYKTSKKDLDKEYQFCLKLLRKKFRTYGCNTCHDNRKAVGTQFDINGPVLSSVAFENNPYREGVFIMELPDVNGVKMCEIKNVDDNSKQSCPLSQVYPKEEELNMGMNPTYISEDCKVIIYEKPISFDDMEIRRLLEKLRLVGNPSVKLVSKNTNTGNGEDNLYVPETVYRDGRLIFSITRAYHYEWGICQNPFCECKDWDLTTSCDHPEEYMLHKMMQLFNCNIPSGSVVNTMKLIVDCCEELDKVNSNDDYKLLYDKLDRFLKSRFNQETRGVSIKTAHDVEEHFGKTHYSCYIHWESKKVDIDLHAFYVEDGNVYHIGYQQKVFCIKCKIHGCKICGPENLISLQIDKQSGPADEIVTWPKQMQPGSQILFAVHLYSGSDTTTVTGKINDGTTYKVMQEQVFTVANKGRYQACYFDLSGDGSKSPFSICSLDEIKDLAKRGLGVIPCHNPIPTDVSFGEFSQETRDEVLRVQGLLDIKINCCEIPPEYCVWKDGKFQTKDHKQLQVMEQFKGADEVYANRHRNISATFPVEIDGKIVYLSYPSDPTEPLEATERCPQPGNGLERAGGSFTNEDFGHCIDFTGSRGGELMKINAIFKLPNGSYIFEPKLNTNKLPKPIGDNYNMEDVKLKPHILAKLHNDKVNNKIIRQAWASHVWNINGIPTTVCFVLQPTWKHQFVTADSSVIEFETPNQGLSLNDVYPLDWRDMDTANDAMTEAMSVDRGPLFIKTKNAVEKYGKILENYQHPTYQRDTVCVGPVTQFIQDICKTKQNEDEDEESKDDESKIDITSRPQNKKEMLKFIDDLIAVDSVNSYGAGAGSGAGSGASKVNDMWGNDNEILEYIKNFKNLQSPNVEQINQFRTQMVTRGLIPLQIRLQQEEQRHVLAARIARKKYREQEETKAAEQRVAVAAANQTYHLQKQNKTLSDINQNLQGQLTEAKCERNGAGENCVICRVKPVNVVFKPCTHACACSECAIQIKEINNKCPLCRSHIVENVTFYPGGTE